MVFALGSKHQWHVGIYGIDSWWRQCPKTNYYAYFNIRVICDTIFIIWNVKLNRKIDRGWLIFYKSTKHQSSSFVKPVCEPGTSHSQVTVPTKRPLISKVVKDYHEGNDMGKMIKSSFVLNRDRISWTQNTFCSFCLILEILSMPKCF